ncbi:MAG: GNAT family N-acetyltransferase [Candidatus Melainabacteria bacterium]|nr:GNAT family N-acetyltransferase [Candidatus Melainabacteria bacterium]
MDIVIRNAVDADAAAIIKVHYDAVHQTAAKDYEQAILDDWSSSEKERVDHLEVQIRINPKKRDLLIAEIGGQIVGFGELDAAGGEIVALYVSPTVNRKGVGQALLAELESIARKQNVLKLTLDSSLTAEPFYSANDYQSAGQHEHQLKSGRKMPCIKMHKDLN